MEPNLSNNLEQINEKVDSITTKLCLLEKKAEEVLSIFNSFENFVSKDLCEASSSEECSDTSTENSNTSENDIYDSENDNMDSDELFLLKKYNKSNIDTDNSNESNESDNSNESDHCNDCDCSNDSNKNSNSLKDSLNQSSNNSEILENLLNVLHQQKNNTNTDQLLDDLINNVKIKD